MKGYLFKIPAQHSDVPIMLVTQEAEAGESKVPNHLPPGVEDMPSALCVTGDRNHFPENQNVGATFPSFLLPQKGKTEIRTVSSDHTKVCQLGGKADLHERQQLSFPIQ